MLTLCLDLRPFPSTLSRHGKPVVLLASLQTNDYRDGDLGIGWPFYTCELGVAFLAAGFVGQLIFSTSFADCTDRAVYLQEQD